MNPYQVLGVKRNALKKTIQKVFRAKVRAAHPDTGGDADAFGQLHLAYKVLMDDERRAKFDRTGMVDGGRPDNAHAEILGVIGHWFIEVVKAILAHGKKPEESDLLALIKANIEKKNHELAEQRKAIEKVKQSLASVAGRFSTEDEDNLLESMVAAHLAGVTHDLQWIAGEEERNRKALEFLKKYRFKVDMKQPLGFTGGWSSSASTSAQSGPYFWFK